MLKNHPNQLIDPKTKKKLLLENFEPLRNRAAVYFDETYIKYFIKEELEEMMRTHRGRFD